MLRCGIWGGSYINPYGHGTDQANLKEGARVIVVNCSSYLHQGAVGTSAEPIIHGVGGIPLRNALGLGNTRFSDQIIKYAIAGRCYPITPKQIVLKNDRQASVIKEVVCGCTGFIIFPDFTQDYSLRFTTDSTRRQQWVGLQHHWRYRSDFLRPHAPFGVLPTCVSRRKQRQQNHTDK